MGDFAMKSILNDVNRLEKAYELFLNLVKSCNGLIVHEDIVPSFHENLKKSNAFIKRYGSNSHTPDSSN
jgi:hypothetical protein